MVFDPATLAGKRLWLRAKDLPTKDLDTATASSVIGGEDALSAFDGLGSSSWTTNGTNTGWLLAKLVSAKVITGYSIIRRDDIPGRNPTAWTLEGSNDGTTFTTLDTRTGITWPTAGQTQSWSFTNTTAYMWYRLNITANWGDGYLSVADLSFVGVITTASVTTWPDQSGTAHHGTITGMAITTDHSTPLGGGSALFSPTTGYFALGDVMGAATAGEVWVVVKPTTTALGFLGASNGGTYPQVYPYSDGNIYEEFGLNARTSFTPTLALTSWRIYRVSSDGTTWQAWLDGVSQKTIASAPLNWITNWVLGATRRGSSGDTGFAGNIAEVFVRSQVSTAQEVTDITAYLQAEHFVAATAPPVVPRRPTMMSGVAVQRASRW